MPPRVELLARLAGGFAPPMQKFACRLDALPRKFAYAMQALIDQRGGVESTGDTNTENEGAAEATPEEGDAEAAAETTTEESES